MTTALGESQIVFIFGEAHTIELRLNDSMSSTEVSFDVGVAVVVGVADFVCIFFLFLITRSR